MSLESRQVIDFHTHVFPDDLAARALPGLAAKAKVRTRYDGTVQGLLASMRKYGVHRSVLQPVATKLEQVDSINRWSLELRRQPELIPFGALYPLCSREQLEAQIHFLTAHQFPGIKLHPDYQQFHPDDDRLEPLYRALQDAGLIILFHAGVDLGCPPPTMGGPQRLAQVLAGFPNLKIVAAHMGGFRMWDEVERELMGKRIWLDTSFCAEECPPGRMREIMQAHGLEKILFGSDGPWGDQGEQKQYLEQLGLAPGELQGVLGGNARRLLKI